MLVVEQDECRADDVADPPGAQSDAAQRPKSHDQQGVSAFALAACAALASAGEHVWPATKGFVHFQFSDYAKLTVLGVLGACAGWPIVTRISSAPQWLFFRLTVLVTLVLWLPDVWIWLKGESTQGVAVLAVMHLAIALITYNVLVHVAQVRTARAGRGTHAYQISEAGEVAAS